MKKLHFVTSSIVLAFLLAINSYSQTCPAGMVSYWKLQESSTTFADSKGTHNGSAAVSAPVQVAGVSGYAQSFASSYIAIPSHADFNWSASSSFSIVAWVKFTEISDIQVIIGRDDNSNQTHWWLGKTAAGKIQWFLKASDGSNGSVESINALNNGQWHEIVAVRDGSTSKNYLYVDGVLQNAGGDVVSLTSNLTSTADVTIGNMIFDGSPNFYYNGAIDEVAIYNIALSSTVINSQYSNIKNYQIGYCGGDSPELLSTPATTAVLSQTYTYDVNASGNTLPKYYLDEKPTSMTIDENTGVISWTPASFSENKPVKVRIQNDKGTIYQNFNIYLSEAPVCRNNLIAYWDFSSNSIPMLDKMNDYELSSSNGGSVPAKAAGRAGAGLSFDGNDSLSMQDSFEPSKVFFDFDDVSTFSIELWMKTAATPSDLMVLLGRDEDANNTYYWLGVEPDGNVRLYLRDYIASPNLANIVSEGLNVLDNAWHHIVVTYNATSNALKLYVDKNEVASTTQNFGNFGGDNALNIGWLNQSPYYQYEGLMDELAIYNTELSPARITSNYTEGAAGKGACVANIAPYVLSTPVTSVNEDAAYSYKLIATDLTENDIDTIYAVTKPSWLTLAYVKGDTTATLSGIPVNANVGVHNVTLRVSDGSINIDQTFTVTVVNVNDAPQITSTPSASINEDVEYSYTIVATDEDAGDILTYTVPVMPSWLSFDTANHKIIGVPTNDNVGVFNVTVNVSDGTANVPQSFTITVANVNDLPIITSIPVDTVFAGDTYFYEITAEDIDDGDVLTFTADSKPSWLNFVGGTTSGILSGLASETEIGTHAVILKVSDGTDNVMQGFTINVVRRVVGINSYEDNIINNVYPNPANNELFVSFKNEGTGVFEIYSLTGELQKQFEIESTEILKLDISDLSNGMYIFKVYQNNNVSVGKFTKK